MHKSIQLGLLAGVIISLTACGGSSGGGSSKPSSSSLSSQVVSSDGPSSVAESSSSEASESSSVESSSAPSSSSAESSSVVSSSVESSVPSSSSSSLSSSSASSEGPVLTGVFLDNVVAGVSYLTAPSGKSGVTSSLGEYEFVDGDTVTFSIGNLTLPPVPAKGVVTPADIALAAHTNDSAAAEVTKVNILQILQTLDKDGDPSNGIQIPVTAASLFTGADVPSVTSPDFDTSVAGLLPDLTLVSEADATAHFDNTLKTQILGSWVFEESEGALNVLSFIDNQHYVIIHDSNDGESQTAGSAEFGTYELDIANKELRVQLIDQSDEQGGLYSDSSAEAGVVTHEIEIDGDTLTLGTPNDGAAIFKRVVSPTNPLVGGWFNAEQLDDGYLAANIMTYLSDTKYVIVHTDNDTSYVGEEPQRLSGEFGTYSLNGTAFKVLSVYVDSNGDGGLYNKENPSDQENEFLEIMPWGDLNFTDDNEGTFSLSRLGGFAAHLQDLNEEGSLGSIVVMRDPAGFSETATAGDAFTLDVVYADVFVDEDEENEGSFAFSFNNDVDEDGMGSGTITAFTGDEDSGPISMTWAINSTGAITGWFTDEDESFQFTIAKLSSPASNNEAKVLFSLISEVENSLWESKLRRNLVKGPQVGSWIDEGNAVITFIDNRRYAITNLNVDDCGDGVEVGYYQLKNGRLHADAVVDVNGSCGIANPEDNLTIEIDGNTLTAFDGQDYYLHTRLQNNDILGTWVNIASEYNGVIISFLPNNQFLFSQYSTNDMENGRNGYETGTYTWNSGTKLFAPTVAVDRNGEWGFSHPRGPIEITVDGDVLTLRIEAEGVEENFARVVGANN